MDTSLKFHLHVQEIYNKACGVSQSNLRRTVYRSPEFMVKAFIMHVRPFIASCVWNIEYLSDLHLLESVKRR